MRARIYVDGFNLYYHIKRWPNSKWLNIDQLTSTIFPNCNIDHIKYFTAHVSARPHDLQQPIRQQQYLRALRTVPHLSVVLGEFMTKHTTMAEVDMSTNPPSVIYDPSTGRPKTVSVMKTEEKGSDVNLASHLLLDGFLGLYDVAIVVSNDTDLSEPLRIVKQELGKRIFLLHPSTYPHAKLSQYADEKRDIRRTAVQSCQFPLTLADSTGTFHKPNTW